MSHAGTPLWGDNRYGGGIPGQQIALWGYKLTFLHPTTRKAMRFYAMPEGNAWGVYADLLTVPEDTEEPRKRKEVHLAPQVIRTFTHFNGRLYVPDDPEKIGEADSENNADDYPEEDLLPDL